MLHECQEQSITVPYIQFMQVQVQFHLYCTSKKIIGNKLLQMKTTIYIHFYSDIQHAICQLTSGATIVYITHMQCFTRYGKKVAYLWYGTIVVYYIHVHAMQTRYGTLVLYYTVLNIVNINYYLLQKESTKQINYL